MSKKEDSESPISEDTYEDDQGRTLWAEGNSQGKRPHSLAVRPEGLGFTPETARNANKARWEKRRQSAEDGVIGVVADREGVDPNEITGEDAWQAIVSKQAEVALDDGKTAAAKFVGQATDSLIRNDPSNQEATHQTLNMLVLNFPSMEAAHEYLDQQRSGGYLDNASFVEGQLSHIDDDEGPIELKVLMGERNAE